MEKAVKEFRSTTSLPDGDYQVKLISLGVERRGQANVVWLMRSTDNINIEYAYSARANRQLTRDNFEIIGVNADDLELLIYEPAAINGREAILTIKNGSAAFTKCLTKMPIIVTPIEVPFG